MGTYYTPSAPAASEGFFLQPETKVLLGDSYLYGSLEVSSWTYTTYGASIGLQAGHSVELGELDSLGFSHVPTFSPVESANIRTSNIYILEGEETSVSVGLREFKPAVIALAIGTGISSTIDDEFLVTFGDKCDMDTRPMSLEFNDVSCQVPDAEDISTGVSGGVITLYDVFASSGLPWDDMNAGSLNVVTLEFMVRTVAALERGNRLGNIYLF